MNALIIDDRSERISSLKFMLSRFCKDVNQIYAAKSIQDGVSSLLQNQIDIIFLDLERFEITELNLIRFKEKGPLKILLFSNSKIMNINALEAYGVRCLQKPYGINTLLNELASFQLAKLEKRCSLENQINLILRLLVEDTVVVSSNTEFLVFDRNEILRFERIKGQVFCVLTNGHHIETTSKLDELFVVLQSRGFLFFRNTYLLNKKYYYKGGLISVDDLEIYKDKRPFWFV